MKKIIALIMAVAVIASMGIVSSFAAEPTWFWNFADGGLAQPPSDVEQENDSVWFKDNSADGDGMLFYGTVRQEAFMGQDVLDANGGYIDLDAGKFVVVKIKVAEDSVANPNKVELLAIPDMDHQSNVAMVASELEATTDWQYILMDASETQFWSGSSMWFRIDPVNYPGSSCNVAWVGLFATQADAEEYIAADKEANATAAPTEAPTAAPAATPAPAEEKGCGSVIGGGAFAMVAMAAAALVLRKKR